jgi:hypothetical protein
MLSLPKILLVLAILAAVIIGTRVFRSWSSPTKKDSVAGGKKAQDAVDLVKCDVCGDYLEASAGSCGRENCPRTG